MSKAKLLGVPRELPEPYPIIEILGPIDSGKKPVAQLVARRLVGTFRPFPVMNPTRPVGQALFNGILSHPEQLEAAPHWWAHLYAAELYEHQAELERLQAMGPVIVTNYLISFRIWARAAGIPSLQGWTSGLPEPRVAYSLVGPAWPAPGNIPLKFSPELVERVNLAMVRPADKRVRKVEIDHEKMPHLFLNKAAAEITSDLHSRYSLPVQESILYQKDQSRRRG